MLSASAGVIPPLGKSNTQRFRKVKVG